MAIEEEYYTIDENGTGSVEVCVTPIGLTTATASVTLATMDGSAVSGDPGIDPVFLTMGFMVKANGFLAQILTIYLCS